MTAFLANTYIYEIRVTVVLEIIGVSETRVPSAIKILRGQLRL